MYIPSVIKTLFIIPENNKRQPRMEVVVSRLIDTDYIFNTIKLEQYLYKKWSGGVTKSKLLLNDLYR